MEPASFNLGTSFTSLQRLALIYSSVPVYTLLIRIATAAFERAVQLMTTTTTTQKTVIGPAAETRQPIRTLAATENNEEEEEEEPLMGRWMQNMLRPSSGLSAKTCATNSPR